ncbi:MAG: hypothetical protein LUQ65_01120 [Candidatus Helarchaeota archaeon]|nr:hypothetical protein [Candidatus Helarchaeota archaeon]
MTALEFIKNLILHPAQTVDVLKEKSPWLLLILTIINAPVFGLLFLTTHFIVNLGIGIFWFFGVGIGIGLLITLGSYLGIYVLIAVLFKEKNLGSSLKVIGYYFIIAFTLYHLITVPIFVALLVSFDYYLVVIFYNISHVILLFWILALSAQGIYKLQQDSESRALMKVFISLFSSWIIISIVTLIVAAELISLIIR